MSVYQKIIAVCMAKAIVMERESGAGSGEPSRNPYPHIFYRELRQQKERDVIRVTIACEPNYRNKSWREIRYCPSFPSKFDAPMCVTVPVSVAARIPAFIAALMEASSMPFKTIS